MEINPNLSENARHDSELINAARSGIEKAFAQLMKRYKEAIYFMLLKMVHNKTDAEDLTIEAFEKAFINIHLYEPQYAFSTWLFCIASNNAIDYLRKKRVVSVPYETPRSKAIKTQQNTVTTCTQTSIILKKLLLRNKMPEFYVRRYLL